MKLARILFACAGLLPGIAAAQQPQGAVVSASAERTAIVESVNAQERSVLLRGQDGQLATVILGPAVRNFAQIKPGDRVVTTVTEAIAASIARADGAAPVGAGAVAARAPEGARPGAGLAEAERVRVRIEGIDLGRNSVAFTTPNGTRREVAVRDPGMRRFIRTLSPGDMVDVVVIESVSIRVLPPG